MVKIETFVELALSFPETEEKPHFDRRAFKVIKKRIFATLHENRNTANLKLIPEEQKAFCSYQESGIYPVPNKFGLQGWTTFELTKVSDELISEALQSAYEAVFRK